MEEIKKQAEVLNAIAYGDTNDTITRVREIMFGYSQYILNCALTDNAVNDRMKDNLYVLNSMIDVLEKSRTK